MSQHLIPDEWIEAACKKHGLRYGLMIQGKFKENPCIAIFGPGPEGKKCKTCDELTGHSCAKTYYKCALRGFTHGPGTDHRVNWPACSKYKHAE